MPFHRVPVITSFFQCDVDNYGAAMYFSILKVHSAHHPSGVQIFRRVHRRWFFQRGHNCKQWRGSWHALPITICMRRSADHVYSHHATSAPIQTRFRLGLAGRRMLLRSSWTTLEIHHRHSDLALLLPPRDNGLPLATEETCDRLSAGTYPIFLRKRNPLEAKIKIIVPAH